MQDSWKIYPPISVPGAGVKFAMPESEMISLAFDSSIDQWSFAEWQDDFIFKPARLAVENEDTEEFVLKESPLSPESLYEVLSLSGQRVAMLPTTGIKEIHKNEEDDDDEPGKEPEPDKDEEYIEPLLAVNVLGPEALGIKVNAAQNKFVSKFEERQRELEAPVAVKKETVALQVQEPAPVKTTGTASADVIEYTQTSSVKTNVAKDKPEVIKANADSTATDVRAADTTATDENTPDSDAAASSVIEMTPSEPDKKTSSKPEIIKAKYKVEADESKKEAQPEENTSHSKSSAVSASLAGVSGIILAASTAIYIAKKKKEKEGDK